MAKNLIPQTAQMLGVELNEEFKIKEYGEKIYRFANSGLQLIYDNGVRNLNITTNMALSGLLSGDLEIVKMPWKPKMYETYYSFDIIYGVLVVCSNKWTGLPYQYALLAKGWALRTKEEAKAALPKVAAEMGVECEI